MLQAAADTLLRTRKSMVSRLQDLTQEQWFAQPDGFANNVAWNIGHLVVAQQFLCYMHLGVDAHDTGNMGAMFGGGTSPADWDEQPDTDELLRLFIELAEKFSADIDAGKFESYEMPAPVEGRFPPAKSVMHAFIFNQGHEGMHYGAIGDLLGYMRTKNE